MKMANTLLRKEFWAVFFEMLLLLILELIFCALVICMYLAIYVASESEILNSITAFILLKVFLSLPPCIYNLNKILIAYKKRDFVKVVGLFIVTALYCFLVWTMGGGGR